MSAETLLDIFDPPKESMVGHSAALVAMTGAEDFLQEAMVRFTGLGRTQRSQLGQMFAFLMLDGHASSSRQEVFPPGRIPGLHEFQPRSVDPGSLLHAKVALLAFAQNRTGAPVHLRLAALTANYTYTSARQQLELVWVVDAPLDGTARPEDRADIAAAGMFVEMLLTRRFHRDEQGLAPKERKLTSRLDALFAAASSLATNRRPRFIHSLDRPLYDQIRERFRAGIDSPRNVLLCGSGFYEQPNRRAAKPEVLKKLEEVSQFTAQMSRVALVDPDEAGAIKQWAPKAGHDGWLLAAPRDVLIASPRHLHAKFVYTGYRRHGRLSNGWLYLGSGNLTRRGLLSSEARPLQDGTWNVETGVVFEVPESMDDETVERRLFWSIDDEEGLDEAKLKVGRVGDAPEDDSLLEVPPILSAMVEMTPARRLRLLWREDATTARVSISWTGRDWFDVQRGDEVPLKDDENPTTLHVRSASDRKWIVPVVDAAGRIDWQPPRFDTYADALAALLDFPIRPAEATDDDDDDDDGDGRRRRTKGPGAGEANEQEKSYALHAAAEFVEKVAALQVALYADCIKDEKLDELQYERVIDDWIDHLDRICRASFPETLIATWRTHRLNVFAHLREPELRPPHLTDKQRAQYFEVLDRAARAWGLR